MAKKMLIDATHAEETRVVVVDGNKVEEFDFESENKRQLAGNIYLAKVTRVEPSLQAAFVDYGGNRHGFLAFAEIHPDYYQIPVADREALMEEERAYAEAMRARDEEEDKKKPSRRRGSKSSTKAAKTVSKDAVKTKDVEPAADAAADATTDTPDMSDTADAGSEIRGMETIDLDEESVAETAAGTLVDDSDGEAAETAEAAQDADETSAASGADEAAPEPTETDDDAVQPAQTVTDDSDAVALADTAADPADAEPAETVEQDTEAAADADAQATVDEADADASDEASDQTEDVHAKDASGEEDSAEDAGADDDNNGEDDGDEDGDDPHADASSRDDTIESVADEDDSDDIRPPRKPRARRYKIQEVIKVRQILLVQVVKEERGNKGAALTTYLSLAGRYCVLMPNTARGGGISRKITSAGDRKKLKEIATEIDVPTGAGLIIRTAGAKRTKTEIKRDYEYLQRLWEQIRELTLQSIAPAKIYEEGDLIKRSIRDLYSREIDEVLVEGERGYRVAKDFMKMIMPSHAKNVQRYEDGLPLFARFQVESYLGAMFNPTVQLKSGGYIVIGVTEALVAIDVNSGRATKEGSIEETALKTNLEASDEIARQLRLRDLAGLIVIDFIDMDERKNNASVEKRMKERLKTDRARIQVGRISGFGLMEMSRQRLRPGMIEATTQPCPACHGTGLIRSDDNMALSILRQVEEEGVRRRSREVLVKCPVGIANFLMNHKREHVAQIEQRYGLSVRLEGDPHLVSPDFSLERFKTATRKVPQPTAPVVSGDASIMDMVDAEDEVEEDQVEEPIEDQAAASSAPEDTEDSPKPKKRRRRRRRRSGKSANAENGEGEAGTDGAAENTDEGSSQAVSDAAEEGGDAAVAPVTAEPAETASDDASADVGDAPASAEQSDETAEATTEAVQSEEPAAVVDATDEAPEAAEPAAETLEHGEAEQAAEAEPEVSEAASDDAPTDEISAATADPDPAPEPEPEPETAEEAAPAPVQEETLSIPVEPVNGAAAPAMAEEPVAVVAEAEPDAPPKPKRRGWWSIGS
ncbi:MAG: Rne/Rng family ribonuclease [Pseudomonadota bacterium]